VDASPISLDTHQVTRAALHRRVSLNNNRVVGSTKREIDADTRRRFFNAARVDPIRATRATAGAKPMANANVTEPMIEPEVPDEPIPAMQQLLDNPFLLLFVGIAMPTVLYIVWGVMEIVGIPIAK
jgi:hypothetical protein